MNTTIRVLAVAAVAIVPAAAAALIAYDAGSAAAPAAVVTETETVTETRIEYVEVEPGEWQSCYDLALLQGWTYEDAEQFGVAFIDADGYDTSGPGYTVGEGCAAVWAALVGAGE